MCDVVTGSGDDRCSDRASGDDIEGKTGSNYSSLCSRRSSSSINSTITITTTTTTTTTTTVWC